MTIARNTICEPLKGGLRFAVKNESFSLEVIHQRRFSRVRYTPPPNVSLVEANCEEI